MYKSIQNIEKQNKRNKSMNNKSKFNQFYPQNWILGEIWVDLADVLQGWPLQTKVVVRARPVHRLHLIGQTRDLGQDVLELFGR